MPHASVFQGCDAACTPVLQLGIRHKTQKDAAVAESCCKSKPRASSLPRQQAFADQVSMLELLAHQHSSQQCMQRHHTMHWAGAWKEGAHCMTEARSAARTSSPMPPTEVGSRSPDIMQRIWTMLACRPKDCRAWASHLIAKRPCSVMWARVSCPCTTTAVSVRVGLQLCLEPR